jgi:hypothetical protein
MDASSSTIEMRRGGVFAFTAPVPLCSPVFI